MTSTDILIMFAELVGGLAFFLYGMSAMSGGLEQMAGGRLERTLKKVTSHDFLSFFLGAGITVAIQSSSAMTVMLVGLVNSGIMSFGDTFGMIMGSHVGTTLTAWILTLSGISGENFFLTLLQPTTFAPILAFVGIVLRMLSKKEKRKHLGMILIGFAVLMAGMDMMSNSMSSLRESPAFIGLLTAFGSPFIALAVSTAFTGIIQSSAATVAIVQALAFATYATENPITYGVAIPLVVGANIGTCMTALISSIGTSRDAKRVVAMHVYTNAIGGIVCVILMYLLKPIGAIGEWLAYPAGMIGVAMIHSIFNIANTVAFVPFKKPLIKFCEKTVRKSTEQTHTVFLDERLFNNTPLAISECRRLTNEMAEYARTALLTAVGLIDHYDEEIAEQVVAYENLTDKYEDKLSTYLVRLSNNELTESDSHQIGRLLHSIGDFERIADHALNMRDTALEILEKNIVFSDSATSEVQNLVNAVVEIVNMSVDSFVSDDAVIAAHVEPLEQVIDDLRDELKAHHVERLQNGECTVQMGFVFNDLLTNCERVADHCSNLAVYTLQLHSSKLDAHKFLNSFKVDPKGEFLADYNRFKDKYHAEE